MGIDFVVDIASELNREMLLSNGMKKMPLEAAAGTVALLESVSFVQFKLKDMNSTRPLKAISGSSNFITCRPTLAGVT
ncbi:conserved hypothetical protein [Ricinus communis]|uniref:Uncharacterized protein n=1 Tax=Ricinus communis TaxID=3988 RepID=B9RH78_RICCO|nr:conserved hypothetical protein [Ricinus communis]